MLALPAPRNTLALSSAMGLLIFYRGYIPNFSLIAAPLNQLLKKGSAMGVG
jgi:hypothetical protein